MTRDLLRLMTRLAWVVALVSALGLSALASTASADGDPASDYLVSNRVFLAAQAGRPTAAEQRLSATVAAANRVGFPVRVAIIPSEYDLGAITELWGRPRLYARFLGLELARVHPGPVLVVMPGGFGVSWAGHAQAGLDHQLAAIGTGSAADLATGADSAVRALAQSAGITLPSTSVASAHAAGAPRSTGGGGTLVAWLAALVALVALAWSAVTLVRRRPRWLPAGFAVLACGAFAVPVLLVVSLHRAGTAPATATAAAAIVTPPPVSWPAGARTAPDFSLRDQAGRPVSVSAFRGRPVIVTFVDPLCRALCPLEAHVLNAAVDSLAPGRRPVILAVSTDVRANARRNLLQDVRRWSLVTQWHWAVGSAPALRDVWRRYRIGVAVTTRHVGTERLRYITHTEAAYVIDAGGHERGLFVWPFAPQDVVRELQRIAG